MQGKRGTKESMKARTPNCTTSRDRVGNTFFGSYLSLRTALPCNLAAKKRERVHPRTNCQGVMIGQSNEQRDEQRDGEVKEQAGISWRTPLGTQLGIFQPTSSIIIILHFHLMCPHSDLFIFITTYSPAVQKGKSILSAVVFCLSLNCRSSSKSIERTKALIEKTQ